MASESDIPQTWGMQLARAERGLSEQGVVAPHQDAAELLSHLLRVPVPMLRAHPASPMRPADTEMYGGWVERRASGEALAHITGHLEFMGLDITVGQSSPLVPPGADRLVEVALHWARRRAPGELLAAEIGTGCGAVALALAALEPCFTRIYAINASPAALEAARANGARYLLNLVVGWLPGEGVDSVPEPVDLIVSSDLAWARLESAAEKLRPGGAVICTVTLGEEGVVAELLARQFPGNILALSWVEDLGGGYAIAVASRRTDSDESVSES